MSFLCFFNHTAPTEIYTLSLHDALPLCIDLKLWVILASTLLVGLAIGVGGTILLPSAIEPYLVSALRDRKSTRLNSSHQIISYAVFCLKKKNTTAFEHS